MKWKLPVCGSVCAAILAVPSVRAQEAPPAEAEPAPAPSAPPGGPADEPEPAPADPAEPPANATDATRPPAEGEAPPAEPSEPSAPRPATPAPKAGTPVEEDDAEDEEEIVPPARDRTSGHFSLAASAAVAIPGGDLQGEGLRDDAISQPTLLDTGAAFGLDLRFGLSRTVMLGVGGDFILSSPPSSCVRTCGGTTFAGEVFASYHPVQGLSLDTWIRYGIGYRGLSVDDGPTYHGLDWMRLRVGGDYFLSSNFALGPFMALDLGHYFDRSGQAIENPVHHMDFLLGIGGTLDLPGK